MRTKYSVINAITAVVFQLLNMVIVFFSRRIFLAELGAESWGSIAFLHKFFPCCQLGGAGDWFGDCI